MATFSDESSTSATIGSESYSSPKSLFSIYNFMKNTIKQTTQLLLYDYMFTIHHCVRSILLLMNLAFAGNLKVTNWNNYKLAPS